MGERSYILIKDFQSRVYLYAHWMTKEECYDLLRKSLARSESRWTDGPYLARVIFSDMIRADIDGLTSFGISSVRDDGNVHYTVSVDDQKVNGISFSDFIKGFP